MKDISEIGAGGAVCLASRFSELNTAEGKEKTKKLIINSGKTPFLGPNCYGFINYFDKVSVWSIKLRVVKQTKVWLLFVKVELLEIQLALITDLFQ